MDEENKEKHQKAGHVFGSYRKLPIIHAHLREKHRSGSNKNVSEFPHKVNGTLAIREFFFNCCMHAIRPEKTIKCKRVFSLKKAGLQFI